MSGFWDATLTPNGRGHGADLVGYRGAGLSIPGFSWESDGAGTLAPASVSLRGVDYTVEVLAIVSDTVDYLHVALRTAPLLPRGQDLWLELEHVDGSTAAFAIDTASVEAPGYLWRDVYAGEDRHGWGTDGSDADMDPDSVTVRLLGPAAPVVAATVSPPSVREDAGTASLNVTVGLVDGEPALGDVPVTVTVGNADDTATATDDYAVVAPLMLTIPAGRASASQSVTIDVVADDVLEAPERVTFAVAAPGHTSGAPGELSIEDPARVEFEYWRGTLSRAAPFEVGKWTLSGYFAPLDAARGSTLTPSRLLCCGGREASPSMRSVRVLGRAEGADRRRMFVLGMNGLIRDGALAPAFAGAALRIDGRVRLLDDAELIDFAGAPALAWPWREAGLPDPAAAAFEVRLTGPDHPVLVAVEAVSSPAGGTSSDRRYAVGETVEIALRFDEPVTVTGVPTLALAIGANTRSPTYAYAPGPRTLVFAYTVVAADADADGIDVGRVADAVTLGTDASIVSVRTGLDAAYGDLDPAPFANHRVDGTLTTPSAPTLSVRGATVGEADGTVTLRVALSFTRSSDVTASWATSDGTAAAGSDYTAASDSLTVTAGDRVTTVRSERARRHRGGRAGDVRGHAVGRECGARRCDGHGDDPGRRRGGRDGARGAAARGGVVPVRARAGRRSLDRERRRGAGRGPDGERTRRGGRRRFRAGVEAGRPADDDPGGVDVRDARPGRGRRGGRAARHGDGAGAARPRLRRGQCGERGGGDGARRRFQGARRWSSSRRRRREPWSRAARSWWSRWCARLRTAPSRRPGTWLGCSRDWTRCG